MIEKIRKNKEVIFIYVSLALYGIISLIGVITHESWADEAQAWLIARDLNIIDIIKQMKYEGHSCLWHLILFPFAQLGFPYETMKYISWIFCLVAAYLILKKAPFHKIIKLLLVFNPAMIYLWPAIARCYAMIPLFVVCIAIYYKDRKKHPYLYATFIALLANTHVIMLPMAGMLFLTFFCETLWLKRKELTQQEKKTFWKSLGIMVVGFLFLLIQVLPAVFQSEIFRAMKVEFRIDTIREIITKVKLSIEDTTYYLFKNTFIGAVVFYISIELLVVASLYDKKQGLIFWLQIIFMILVHGLLWFVIKQRALLIILYIMFFAWTYEPKFKKEENLLVKKLPNIALFLLLIITLINYPMLIDDIKANYSASKEVAQYIETNLPKGSVFICPNNESASPVFPYLNKEDYKFYSPNARRYYTYVSWDDDWKKISSIKKIEQATRKMKSESKTDVYILVNIYDHLLDEFSENEEKYEKILIADNTFHEYYSAYEDYYLYRIKL